MRTYILILVLLSACGKAPDPTAQTIDGSWTEVHGQAKVQFQSGSVFIEMVNADGTFPAQTKTPQFTYTQDGLTLHKHENGATVDCPLTFKSDNDVTIECPDHHLPFEVVR